MPILEVAYDPAWAAVRIVVDGGMWPSAVSQIRIERTSAGYPVIPVRGVEDLWAAGGYFIGTDHEMPLGASVTYTVYGFNEHGDPVAQESANVTTVAPTGDAVWVKVPGRPDLSSTGRLREVGAIESETRGGAYQVHGGGAIAQWSGTNTDAFSISLETWGASERARLAGTLRAGRVLLIQPPSPAEFEQGWFFVSGASSSNPYQLSMGSVDVRRVEISLRRTDLPAGLGVQSTGTTWQGVMDEYATWQDVIDAQPTWFDVLQGA